MFCGRQKGREAEGLQKKKRAFSAANIHQFGPRQSIMVWAAISESGKSQIIRFNGNITARRYQNEALGHGLLPFVNTHAHQMQYMHDNAPAHRAIATRNWLHNNNIQVFGPWPSKSPDMNPIENLWAQMETAIQGRANRPRNRNELWQAVRQEWANINMFDIRRLVLSMRRRCTALMQAGGHHTRY